VLPASVVPRKVDPGALKARPWAAGHLLLHHRKVPAVAFPAGEVELPDPGGAGVGEQHRPAPGHYSLARR
jgi:hypothetical protein